ncbi:DinB family protein [Fulvivirgaceae bacterium BMA10]|uniref:DinB family protein n=1 Tax=Splendidivirga corallicola TaxID=3051826 RepID=A0ABT8KUI6_9BACT|nr:DinB family protein [Fulvivirgaceae bacterium BMA10]
MAKQKIELFLAQQKQDTMEIIGFVKSELQQMDETLLLKKPSPGKWSIIECLEHLNITGRLYIPQMEERMISGEKLNSNGSSFYSSGFMGSWSIKSMKPLENGKIKSSMKTFKSFEPKLKDESGQEVRRIIDEFQEQQNRLLEVIRKSREMNLNKNKITSALGKILRFRLGDAIAFLIAHNQRHILQIKKTLNALEFSTSQ